MTTHSFTLAGTELRALPSGALHWPAHRLLCVSDLHLGNSERRARPSGPSLTQDTLARLETDLKSTDATTVICLGDSFDGIAAAQALSEDDSLWISTLQAGRRWVWIEGTHDPGPVDLGGTHLAELPIAPLTFRHVARPGASGEVSGHFHPKVTLAARGRSVTRPAFLIDGDRVILPAYGRSTGGLRATDPALQTLMRKEASAVLTGTAARAIPMPR